VFTVCAKSVMEVAEQARAMYPNHNLTTYPWKMSQRARKRRKPLAALITMW
jgi:hypothetical protein